MFRGIILTMMAAFFFFGPPAYAVTWWIDAASACGDESSLYLPKGERWKAWLLLLAWLNSFIFMAGAAYYCGKDDSR